MCNMHTIHTANMYMYSCFMYMYNVVQVNTGPPNELIAKREDTCTRWYKICKEQTDTCRYMIFDNPCLCIFIHGSKSTYSTMINVSPFITMREHQICVRKQLYPKYMFTHVHVTRCNIRLVPRPTLLHHRYT